MKTIQKTDVRIWNSFLYFQIQNNGERFPYDNIKINNAVKKARDKYKIVERWFDFNEEMNCSLVLQSLIQEYEREGKISINEYNKFNFLDSSKWLREPKSKFKRIGKFLSKQYN